MIRSKNLSIPILSLFATLTAGRVRAQESHADEKLEEEAQVACLAGRVAEGVELLARLFLKTQEPIYIYNQGRCFEQNGQNQQALARFEEFLRRAPSLADEERVQVQSRIARLKTVLPGQSAPAQSPGKMNRKPEPRPEGPSARQGEATGWPIRSKLAIGALAGGALAMIGGATFHILREQRADDFNAGCGTSNLSLGSGCSDKKAAVDSAQTFAIVGYLSALVLGGAGAYLMWGGRGTGDVSDPAVLSCRPEVNATVGLLSCGGIF